MRRCVDVWLSTLASLAFQSSLKPSNENGSRGVCVGLFLGDSPLGHALLMSIPFQRLPATAEMSVIVWNSVQIRRNNVLLAVRPFHTSIS